MILLKTTNLQFKSINLIILGTILLLTYLYFHHNACIPLTVDELGSWGLSLGNSSYIIEKTLFSQGQGPAYFILLSKWISAYGNSKEAMRLLSLCLHLINCLLIFKIGTTLVNRSFAVILLATYYLSPIIFTNEILARPYSLATLILSAIILSSVSFTKNKNVGYLLPLGILIPLLIFTHYLYLISLPPISLLIFVTSEKADRKKATMIWGCFVGLQTLITLFLIKDTVTAKTSRITDLASAELPNLIYLLVILTISSLGIGLIAFILTRLILKPSQKDATLQPILVCGLIGLAFCYLSLFFLPYIIPGTFFLARYFSIASFYGALFLTALINLYPNLKWPMFSLITTLYAAENYYHHQINGCNYDNKCKTAIEKILKNEPENCEIFASTGFIELQNPEYLENPLYEDFLTAPLSYYTKKEINLLPISISSPKAKVFYEDTILPAMEHQSCLLLYPNTETLVTEGLTLKPIANNIEETLRNLQYKLKKPIPGCSLIVAIK